MNKHFDDFINLLCLISSLCLIPHLTCDIKRNLDFRLGTSVERAFDNNFPVRFHSRLPATEITLNLLLNGHVCAFSAVKNCFHAPRSQSLPREKRKARREKDKGWESFRGKFSRFAIYPKKTIFLLFPSTKLYTFSVRVLGFTIQVHFCQCATCRKRNVLILQKKSERKKGKRKKGRKKETQSQNSFFVCCCQWDYYMI